MYQPSHFTTEIGRMRAEEMRARAERYRTIQKAKQHKKAESEPEPEESLSRSRTFVYRKALGVVGLSLLLVLVFAAAALAMPVDAPPGVGGSEEALVPQPQVREGPPSVWEAQSAAVGGQERADIQHVGDAQPATVAGVFGGQERADIQHVAEAQPQPSTNLEPSSGGIDLEIVLLTGTLALMAVGALLWFRRHTIKPA
jgi:hypothetical protein